MSTVATIFGSASDFELAVATAKQNANGSREEDFIAGLEDRYKTYGLNTFISEAQDRWLTDIIRRG
jgi:hypothetical protein